MEPAAGQQLPLFVPQAARGARLDWQLARLAIAFGSDRIHRIELTDPEAPLAETRWRWVPVAGAAVLGSELVPELVPPTTRERPLSLPETVP